MTSAPFALEGSNRTLQHCIRTSSPWLMFLTVENLSRIMGWWRIPTSSCCAALRWLAAPHEEKSCGAPRGKEPGTPTMQRAKEAQGMPMAAIETGCQSSSWWQTGRSRPHDWARINRVHGQAQLPQGCSKAQITKCKSFSLKAVTKRSKEKSWWSFLAEMFGEVSVEAAFFQGCHLHKLQPGLEPRHPSPQTLLEQLLNIFLPSQLSAFFQGFAEPRFSSSRC